jgi:gentisate 1,2-dioxygenase
MTWHDHGNETDQPMFWLDGLDIPLVQFLDASFVEHLGAEEQAVTKPTGDSLARYGANLLPVDYRPEAARPTSPVFHYPYDRSREALDRLARAQDWDPCHGLKMRFVNPATGDHAMPTMGAFLQLLPKGFETRRHRATDATVYICLEGGGRSRIGEETLAWGPRDVFVAPSWQPVSHTAEAESVLFSFSDRPVQEKLGLWREDRVF